MSRGRPNAGGGGTLAGSIVVVVVLGPGFDLGRVVLVGFEPGPGFLVEVDVEGDASAADGATRVASRTRASATTPRRFANILLGVGMSAPHLQGDLTDAAQSFFRVT